MAVPHRLFEQAVGLAVVADGTASTAEIQGQCRSLLGPHAVPEAIVVVRALPRTAWGKVDRPALTRLIASRRPTP